MTSTTGSSALRSTTQRLVLITCADPYDLSGGGYRDNLIVVAKPLGGPRPLGR